MTYLKKQFQLKKVDDKRYMLDVRGLSCPYPQILTIRGLSKLASNNLLEVIVDNPPSVKEIPTVIEEKGYKVSTLRLNSATWKITIQS